MRKLSTGLSSPDRSFSRDNPPFYLTVEKIDIDVSLHELPST
jgi:hypothetical protein